MKKILQLLLFAALAVTAPAQVQNMQAASGTTGDLTKPTLGFNLASGQTLNVKTGAIVSGAGSYDFTSGTKLVVPNGAAPTTSAFGWLAGDNNAWAASRGALQFYDGTANTYLVGALVSDTPTDGQVPTWHTGGTITWDSPAAGSIGGSSGSVDKALISANGTGGATVQGNGAATISADAAITLPRASLAANTSGDGLVMSNSGTVSSGNQMYSPRLRLTGSGWKTNAVAAAQLVDWIAETIPVQGAAAPTSQLTFSSQINAGGYTVRAVLDSGGSIYLGPSATAGSISSTSGTVQLTASNSNANVNADPIGTGIASISKDTVMTDSTSSRTWQGDSARVGFGAFVQRSATKAEFNALAVGTGQDVAFYGQMANGSYGSLSATESGRKVTFGLRTYGGTTWLTQAGIQITTTQTQSETARGCKITLAPIPNTTTVAIAALVADQDGSVKALYPTGGIGYGTGAGGAQTQGSSRTTTVVSNTVTGAITLFSAAGSTTPTTFTVTCSPCAATDVVIVSQKSGTDLYEIFVTNVAAGSFKITFFTTGGTTTETPVFNYAVIHGAAS